MSMDLLKRSLFDLRQRGKNQWLERRGKALDYYRGEVDDFTKKYFRADKHNLIPFSNNNVTKRIIDRISLVYSEPAVRNVDNDIYSDLTQKKNVDLLHAERMTNLLNINILKVSLRPNEFRYKIIRDFEIETDADGNIFSVAYPIGAGPAILGSTSDLWEQWDIDNITVFNNGTGQVVSKEENPFGIIPFVIPRTTEGRYSFTDVEPATDLVGFNEAINVNEANLNFNIHFQSFSKLIITGVDQDTADNAPKIDTGPDAALLLTGTSDTNVSLLSPNDTIASVGNEITRKAKTIAGNYHLTTAFLEGQESAQSGVALRIRNEELRAFRKESVILWGDMENQIYNIERQMMFMFDGTTLPEEFSVDFKEKEAVFTQTEQEAQDNHDLMLNITTPAMLLQRDDPDKFDTPEEYQEFIDTNKAINNPAEVNTTLDLNSVLQS